MVNLVGSCNEKSWETIKTYRAGKHSSVFLNGWSERNRSYQNLGRFCPYGKQFRALLWTGSYTGISPAPESLSIAHVNFTPFSNSEAAFLIIENMHIAKGKALIIQPLSQYRGVIHYWVQSKVKNIKLQPLSKMVTGMVVMTQSEYIVHRKQGQEYSRLKRVAESKLGTASLQSRGTWDTARASWSRGEQQKGQPPTNRTG